MRSLAALVCILYLVINLLTEEVECRGGKGGSRGFNNKYTRQGRRGTKPSKGIAGVHLFIWRIPIGVAVLIVIGIVELQQVSPTVWKIVGIGFAVVTVIGLVGFLVLYNFCDRLPDDEENSPEKTAPLVANEHDQLHMENEIS